jgi:tetratricopeptide (TPR) repeat protein
LLVSSRSVFDLCRAHIIGNGLAARVLRVQPSEEITLRVSLSRFALFLATCLLCAGHAVHAQTADASADPSTDSTTAGRPEPPLASEIAAEKQEHGELVLVLPFDNEGTPGTADWIGSAFPEIMDRRFAAAGFLPVNRGDRIYALEHLGLPGDFRPTHASALRLAQTLDVDDVIFGSYQVTGTRITATARLLDVAKLHESDAITESADLSHLTDVMNALAWKIVRQIDPTYPVAEQTFLAADANLRLDGFEDYIRGLVQGKPADQITHLREAVSLNPDSGRAWLALGDAYFAQQDYDDAAIAYGHLTRNDPDALQADFYRGLAFFYTGKYLQAEDAFAFVANRMPLPEVVNDEGVAAARRGKDGAPFFQQAITGDPRDADYHFNLALAYARQGNAANALREATEALRLKPADTEIQSFVSNLKTPGFLQTADAGAATSTSTGQEPADTALPLERIKRSYDEAEFRQVAFEMDQMEALHAATEPVAKQVTDLLAEAGHYLNAGLLVESEREYTRALAVDPHSAAAYAGIARIRERTAEYDEAAQLAQKSIGIQDNADAHLVLARMALLKSRIPDAAQQVAAALRLEPTNTEALGLKQAVTARGGVVPQ